MEKVLDVGCSGHEGAPLKLPSKNPVLGAQLTDGPQIKLELGLFPVSNGSRQEDWWGPLLPDVGLFRWQALFRLPPNVDPRSLFRQLLCWQSSWSLCRSNVTYCEKLSFTHHRCWGPSRAHIQSRLRMSYHALWWHLSLNRQLAS